MWLKAAIGVLVGVALVIACALLSKTSGFSASNCASNIPNSKKWQMSVSQVLLQEVNEILQQPFSYVGRGYLSYALVSNDGKYSLRFLRHQRFHNKRKMCLFNSYKMACEMLPEETGTIFVQLNKPTKGLKKVKILDVDLDATEFVLQKKGEDVFETLEALMQKKQVEAAKTRVDQLFSLLQSLSKKGVVDLYRPSGGRLNMAFLGKSAILVDCGKLRKMSKGTPLQENLQIVKPLNKWLMLHYPELSIYFQEKCKRFLTGTN